MKASWFRDAFGFPEPKPYHAARAAFEVREVPSDASPPTAGPALELEAISTNRVFHIGPFEDPTVAQLRARVADMKASHSVPAGALSFHNIAAEALSLHLEAASAGGVFQAASQFNCLEMVDPSVAPEDGITRYYCDRTQGPACAIACPAATVYRNYHVYGRGQAGGSEAQLDLARDAGAVVANDELGYWHMQNGYLMPGHQGALSQLAERLRSEDGLAERVRESLRVGVHWDTESAAEHRVTQVFTSAVPCAYARNETHAVWEPLARLALDAAYEGTLLVGAALALHRGHRVAVYLTCVGGGAFGNEERWILDAIERAVDSVKSLPLDVFLVHYGQVPASARYRRMEREMSAAGAAPKLQAVQHDPTQAGIRQFFGGS